MIKISFAEIGGSNSLVLCATGRLAQALRVQHNQAHKNNSQWETLNSKTVDQWLSCLGEEISLKGIGDSPTLELLPLDAVGERLIWERAIIEVMGHDAEYLFDVISMAQTAVEANELVNLWGVPIKHGISSKENLLFIQWREKFLSICKKLGVVDRLTQMKALVAEVRPASAMVLNLPARVIFAGFDRFNPIDIELQQRFSEMSIEFFELEMESPKGSSRAISYPDTSGEILAAVIWAKNFMEQQPQAKLAIVVPDLASNGDLVHDTLQDVLAPSTLHASLSEVPMPFNLSLGRSLDKYPLVSTALDLLEVLAGSRSVGQDRFSFILRSPFWSASLSEAPKRALFEARIRERVAPRTSLQRLQEVVDEISSKVGDCQQLRIHLASMSNEARKFSGRKLPSAWRDVFLGALKNVGWLYERKLTHHEYQTRSALFGEFDRLATFDFILGEIGAAKALSRLSELCGERVFQPKTEGNPPLQILGLLEASGLSFDAVWVTGMIDTNWPPVARPNPLLSAQAQRLAGSPSSCATVQLAFAQNVQRRLAFSGREMIYSWPRADKTTELRSSPLIDHLLPEAVEERPISPHWIFDLFKYPNTHLAPPIEDQMAPPVRADEVVKGGTWILRAQALCPAWAYFQFRLGAKKLEEPVEGLDRRKQGTLVHKVLENFWLKIVTSETLHAMNNLELEAEISYAAEQALVSYDADHMNVTLNPQYRKLEKARLVKLIKRWMVIELERANPFSVIACEREISVNIDGVVAKVQADRIDQLESGQLLIIDYKTGASVDTKNWASERITEPQLPVYAAIHRHTEGAVIGVAFAKVLLSEPSVSGLAGCEGLVPSLASFDSKRMRKLYPEENYPDWSSVLNAWKDRLESIAKEIQSGDAGVRFASEADLNYCDVKPLLRLSERRNQLSEWQGRSVQLGGGI
jgi:exodeoxyribonuclease-5